MGSRAETSAHAGAERISLSCTLELQPPFPSFSGGWCGFFSLAQHLLKPACLWKVSFLPCVCVNGEQATVRSVVQENSIGRAEKGPEKGGRVSSREEELKGADPSSWAGATGVMRTASGSQARAGQSKVD